MVFGAGDHVDYGLNPVCPAVILGFSAAHEEIGRHGHDEVFDGDIVLTQYLLLCAVGAGDIVYHAVIVEDKHDSEHAREEIVATFGDLFAGIISDALFLHYVEETFYVGVVGDNGAVVAVFQEILKIGDDRVDIRDYRGICLCDLGRDFAAFGRALHLILEIVLQFDYFSFAVRLVYDGVYRLRLCSVAFHEELLRKALRIGPVVKYQSLFKDHFIPSFLRL